MMEPSYSVQRSALFCAPGLVKFVAAVARLFCLALPGSILNVFVQNKGDLCMVASKMQNVIRLLKAVRVTLTQTISEQLHVRAPAHRPASDADGDHVVVVLHLQIHRVP